MTFAEARQPYSNMDYGEESIGLIIQSYRVTTPLRVSTTWGGNANRQRWRIQNPPFEGSTPSLPTTNPNHYYA